MNFDCTHVDCAKLVNDIQMIDICTYICRETHICIFIFTGKERGLYTHI